MMRTNTAFDDDPSTMLPARLDIGTFDQVSRILDQKHGADINVDAQAVTHLGAIGLQLLVAATNTATARGGRLNVYNPSSAFAQAIEDFGILADALGGRS